jgi:hypothetical protein
MSPHEACATSRSVVLAASEARAPSNYQVLGELLGGRALREHRAGDGGAQVGIEQLEHGDHFDEVLVGVVRGVGQPQQPGALQPLLPVGARIVEQRAAGDVRPCEVVGRGHGRVGEHARVIALERGLLHEPGQTPEPSVDERVVVLAHSGHEQPVAEHRLAVPGAGRRLVVMEVVGVRAVGELKPGPRSRHHTTQRPHGRRH